MPQTALLTQISPHTKAPLRTASRGRRLTPQQALDLRDEYQLGVSTRSLAVKYGVSSQTAHRIATGQAYCELNSLANPKARMPWVDPPVRRRGGCDEAEIMMLAPMLRAYPNRRALVKQTKLYPHISPCTVPGVVAMVERMADGFGVFLQWVGEQRATA
jgi:hypothetical protein